MNDLLLLSMMLGGPKYGYQIKREAGWITGQGDMHSNLVYPLLKRFLGEGWVRKKAVPGERGQTRQQYVITAGGRRYLFARLSEFSEADAASEAAFHLRAGLFPALKPEVREHILARREKSLQRRGEALTVLQKNMDLGKFGGEVVRHMRQQIAMELEWARRLRRMTKNHRGEK
jgi:DNA-binding PadR family transcriptional regulator